MFMRSFKPGDLALFTLAGWFDPLKDRLPVVILIYQTTSCGAEGWFIIYLLNPERKRFVFNSELIEV